MRGILSFACLVSLFGAAIGSIAAKDVKKELDRFDYSMVLYHARWDPNAQKVVEMFSDLMPFLHKTLKIYDPEIKRLSDGQISDHQNSVIDPSSEEKEKEKDSGMKKGPKGNLSIDLTNNRSVDLILDGAIRVFDVAVQNDYADMDFVNVYRMPTIRLYVRKSDDLLMNDVLMLQREDERRQKLKEKGTADRFKGILAKQNSDQYHSQSAREIHEEYYVHQYTGPLEFNALAQWVATLVDGDILIKDWETLELLKKNDSSDSVAFFVNPNNKLKGYKKFFQSSACTGTCVNIHGKETLNKGIFDTIVRRFRDRGTPDFVRLTHILLATVEGEEVSRKLLESLGSSGDRETDDSEMVDHLSIRPDQPYIALVNAFGAEYQTIDKDDEEILKQLEDEEKIAMKQMADAYVEDNKEAFEAARAQAEAVNKKKRLRSQKTPSKYNIDKIVPIDDWVFDKIDHVDYHQPHIEYRTHIFPDSPRRMADLFDDHKVHQFLAKYQFPTMARWIGKVPDRIVKTGKPFLLTVIPGLTRRSAVTSPLINNSHRHSIFSQNLVVKHPVHGGSLNLDKTIENYSHSVWPVAEAGRADFSTVFCGTETSQELRLLKMLGLPLGPTVAYVTHRKLDDDVYMPSVKYILPTHIQEKLWIFNQGILEADGSLPKRGTSHEIPFTGELSEEKHQEITKEIQAWIRGIWSGDVKPDMLSSKPLSRLHNRGPIYQLSALEFEQKIMSSDDNSVLIFTAPDCHNCQHLLDTTRRLARAFERYSAKRFTFYQIDGTHNEIIGINVNAYPTIVVYPQNNKTKAISLVNAPNKPEDIVEFISQVADVDTAEIMRVFATISDADTSNFRDDADL